MLLRAARKTAGQASGRACFPRRAYAEPEADPENGLAFSAAVPADRKRRPSALPCLPRFLCSTLRGRPIAVCRTSDASPERRPRAGPAEGPCPFCLNAFSEQSAAWLCSLYIMPRRQCQLQLYAAASRNAAWAGKTVLPVVQQGAAQRAWVRRSSALRFLLIFVVSACYTY